MMVVDYLLLLCHSSLKNCFSHFIQLWQDLMTIVMTIGFLLHFINYLKLSLKFHQSSKLMHRYQWSASLLLDKEWLNEGICTHSYHLLNSIQQMTHMKNKWPYHGKHQLSSKYTLLGIPHTRRWFYCQRSQIGNKLCISLLVLE